MVRPAVLLLLMLLPGHRGATQAVPPPPDERIVRVWLGSPGPFAPGEPVRVYVQTAEDGYLMVLRSGTDGVIRVLYPSHPRDPQLGAYTRAGTYEIRAAGETVAFKIDEPLGTGRVLAALSSQPYRAEEFVHQTSWNPDALVGTGSAGDLEGAMTDIVQRMLGAGYFTYDVVEYTVAQRPYVAQAPGYPPAAPDAPLAYPEYVPGNFVSVIVIDPFLALPCDPYYGVCVGFPFVGYRPPPRQSGLCSYGEDCWRQDRTMALVGGRNPALRAGSVPRRPYAARAGAAVAARRTTLVPDARTLASLARRPAAAARSASGAVPARSAVQRTRPATPTPQAVRAASLVATAKPSSASARAPQPAARARPRVPGTSLAPAPVPQRPRGMSYRPMPARSGTAAAPGGARPPATGSARAALGGRTAGRAVVPSRGALRHR
jgi:hypothetical protein